tara:strand:- start:274 stop:519 length:246 start_codon:yes stop_codon:yes gene_type:complete
MKNKERELCFILALCTGFKITKEQVIEAWNRGAIYIFNYRGIEQWYLDIIDHKGDWEPLLTEDIKEGVVLALDNNTFAMYI